MTQEEKQLLLKDLCARLPYGVILNVDNGKYREDKKLWSGLFDSDDLWNAKPYLRPMSSMTDEESKEYETLVGRDKNVKEYIYVDRYDNEQDCLCDYIDWLNKHHFDYRGLISMGLALEAPEGMYW